MKKLNDLRFIIGLFFCLVGAALLVISLLVASEKPFGNSLNHFAGAAMLLFGLTMLWLQTQNTNHHQSTDNQ